MLCAYDRLGACGGPYAWAVDFAGFLQSWADSLEVLVFCPGGRQNSSIAASCERLGTPSPVLDTGRAKFLEEQVEWILTRWSRRPSSVLIANLVLPALYASRWIRRAGGRTVGVIHSNPDHDPFYGDVLRHFVGGPPEWRLDAVVAVSDYLTGRVKERAPAGMHVATIPCGTRLPAVKASPPAGELRLLYCGRLSQEQKRIRELTAAVLDASEIPGVRATLCGDGQERSWLEARLANQNRVQYAGNLPHAEMHKLMAQHHVLVLLSDYEGLPMALVEGMACGLVPVCLDEPSGVREVIKDGMNGFIVDDRGPAFLQAIRRLTDPQVWTALSVEARDSVMRRYAHPVVFAKWEALLRDLAASARPQPHHVPRRITLAEPRKGGWFRNYGQYRPTWQEALRSNFQAAWTRLRLKVRPRARLRALLRSHLQG